MSELKNRILARKLETVSVPEPGWEGTFVRALPANRRKEVADLENAPDGLERIVALAVVDESGAPVFGEEDISALGALSLGEMNRVSKQFFDLNGWSAKGDKEAGNGSSPTPTSTSPTPSSGSSAATAPGT